MIVRTFGEKINSLFKERRELFIETEPKIDLSSFLQTLIDAWRMIEAWKVEVPTSIPWYRVKPCPYCVEIIKRRYEKHRTTYGDWYWSFCKRHATAEFLSQISIIDNKEREFLIDGEVIKIVVSTNKHHAKYTLTKKSITAILDDSVFTFKPHINAYPFEPSYNVIIKHTQALLDELVKVLQNPHELEYQFNIYFNDQLIYEVK